MKKKIHSDLERKKPTGKKEKKKKSRHGQNKEQKKKILTQEVLYVPNWTSLEIREKGTR
jgi:hypothetical protein